jgi:hypothetical protein
MSIVVATHNEVCSLEYTFAFYLGDTLTGLMSVLWITRGCVAVLTLDQRGFAGLAARIGVGVLNFN